MPAQRVVFGTDAVRRVPAVLESLDRSRPLLIASGSAKAPADELAGRLAPAARVHEVVQHVPESLAESTRALAVHSHADAVLTIGGGSATGLGKAVAVATGLPIVAVPTTYAGSELTAVYGVTGPHKVTRRDPRAVPVAVVYDPRLTVSMPRSTTASSGLNALAHCVEATYASGRSPVATLAAEAGARALADGLRGSVRAPDALDARSSALYGAMLAGWAMNLAGTSVHHALCHVVGGTYRLPHAEVHAVLLPHVVAMVEASAPERLQGIADALGSDRASTGVAALARDLGAPESLAALGMPEGGLDEAAERAAAAVDGRGPVAVDAAVLRRLLGDAFAGRGPGGPARA